MVKYQKQALTNLLFSLMFVVSSEEKSLQKSNKKTADVSQILQAKENHCVL